MEPPRVPPLAPEDFVATARTRWSDEDNQSVLNNATYLTLLEEARFAWCRALGAMVGEDVGQGFPFVLAQTNVRFAAPGRGGVDVRIELTVTHVGTRSFTQAYRVRTADTDEVWCEAEAVLVAWDPDARRSRELAPAFRTQLLAALRTP